MKLIIEPGRSAKHYWRDVWQHRELMYFLALRDISVRYKQTVIGVMWAALRPGLTMLIFLAFRRLAGLTSSGVPEPLFVLAAVLPWQFFSSALADASGSLLINANLISKVYFPRLIVPTAAVFTSLVDFAITFALLALVSIGYGFVPGIQLLALPFFVVEVVALSIGLGVLLAALNVEYRDFRYVVPFIVQLGFFVSPIAIKTQDVPPAWRLLYSLNPMVGVIDGFRWSLLRGVTPLDWQALWLSIFTTACTVGLGVWYFRRTERNFSDVI